MAVEKRPVLAMREKVTTMNRDAEIAQKSGVVKIRRQSKATANDIPAKRGIDWRPSITRDSFRAAITDFAAGRPLEAVLNERKISPFALHKCLADPLNAADYRIAKELHALMAMSYTQGRVLELVQQQPSNPIALNLLHKVNRDTAAAYDRAMWGAGSEAGTIVNVNAVSLGDVVTAAVERRRNVPLIDADAPPLLEAGDVTDVAVEAS